MVKGVDRNPANTIDVTKTDWCETFQHSEGHTFDRLEKPLAATYKHVLEKSGSKCGMFRASPLPDERMKTQEGFFLGSAVPKTHKVPAVLGLNPIEDIPGEEKLQKLLRTERGKGRPVGLPLLRDRDPRGAERQTARPLKHTYNRCGECYSRTWTGSGKRLYASSSTTPRSMRLQAPVAC